MATYNGADMTSGPVKAIHAGVNVKISTYTQDETISAAGQINMHRLPGGAEVVDVKLFVNGAPGTGLAVKDSHGNIYLNTCTLSTAINLSADAKGLGQRLTSSAYMYIEQNGLIAAQAGADSCKYTLITSYLSEKDPD